MVCAFVLEILRASKVTLTTYLLCFGRSTGGVSTVPPIAANSDAVCFVLVMTTFCATFLPAGVTWAFLVDKEQNLKPVTSNLRACQLLFLLTMMREKLNTLLGRLEKGAWLDSMSDAEKAECLRFGNSEGRFLSKSLSYHAAHFRPAWPL